MSDRDTTTLVNPTLPGRTIQVDPRAVPLLATAGWAEQTTTEPAAAENEPPAGAPADTADRSAE